MPRSARHPVSRSGTVQPARTQAGLTGSRPVVLGRTDGREGERRGRGRRRERVAVGEQLAVVVEEHDPVAQQAPALYRISLDHPRRAVVGRRRGWAGRYVIAHARLLSSEVLVHRSGHSALLSRGGQESVTVVSGRTSRRLGRRDTMTRRPAALGWGPG